MPSAEGALGAAFIRRLGISPLGVWPQGGEASPDAGVCNVFSGLWCSGRGQLLAERAVHRRTSGPAARRIFGSPGYFCMASSSSNPPWSMPY